MSFLFRGLQWMHNNEMIRGDVRIKGGLIHELQAELQSNVGEKVILFNDHYLYPGLINAHDHLEMNLYPRLGHPPYENYTTWGKDIYKPLQSPVRDIEKIDIRDRLLWGGLKNLISGATTVVHHNPWNRIFDSKLFPVRVPKNIAWSHSLAFGKEIQKTFRSSNHLPFTIHAAEGVDAVAGNEIEALSKLGMLAANTVLIHAIALQSHDIEKIRASQCSIVWCPASNLFLFNHTAPIDVLKESVSVALGSDSTLTGSSTLLDEIHCALQTGLANGEEIYKMVTQWPAKIFDLPLPALTLGSPADLMIAPIVHPDYFENLQRIGPESIQAVTVKGELRLVDEVFSGSIGLQHSLLVKGVRKRTTMDVASLIKRLRKQVDETVLQGNPLWQMIAS